MNTNPIIKQIIDKAREVGLNQTELAVQAGIHPVSLSRALSHGRCQLSTIETLCKAVGLRLICVPDNDLAERLRKGEVF